MVLTGPLPTRSRPSGTTSDCQERTFVDVCMPLNTGDVERGVRALYLAKGSGRDCVDHAPTIARQTQSYSAGYTITPQDDGGDTG